MKPTYEVKWTHKQSAFGQTEVVTVYFGFDKIVKEFSSMDKAMAFVDGAKLIIDMGEHK